MLKTLFDYEVLHKCQYPVAAKGCPEPEADCGEPAPYRVFWCLEDGTDAGEMLVCQEHFDFIRTMEAQSFPAQEAT